MAKAKQARSLDPKKRKFAEMTLGFIISYLFLLGLTLFLIAPKVEFIPPMPLALAVNGIVFLIASYILIDTASLIAIFVSFGSLIWGGYQYNGLWGGVIGFVIWFVLALFPVVRPYLKIGEKKTKTKVVQKQPIVNVTHQGNKPPGDYVGADFSFTGNNANGQPGVFSARIQDILGMGEVGLATEALKAESEARRLQVEEKKIAVDERKLEEERIRDRRNTWERWLKEDRITQEEFDRKMALLGEEGFAVPEPEPTIQEGDDGPDFTMDYDRNVVGQTARTMRKKSGERKERRGLFRRSQ